MSGNIDAAIARDLRNLQDLLTKGNTIVSQMVEAMYKPAQEPQPLRKHKHKAELSVGDGVRVEPEDEDGYFIGVLCSPRSDDGWWNIYGRNEVLDYGPHEFTVIAKAGELECTYTK